MPTINGITFYEDNNSCKLSGGRDTPLTGRRILRCVWADRIKAVTALLGKISIYRDSSGNETRQILFPPDTFPGWDNLEAAEFDIEPIGAPSEGDDGGAAYLYARFTLAYKAPEYSQASDSGGDVNSGQFYETEQVDYESSFITVPGGTFTVGGKPALDVTAYPVTIINRTFTKRDLASIPDFSSWIDKVNKTTFPPTGGASAGTLRFAGAKSTKKINAAGLVRYDASYVFKERSIPWNWAFYMGGAATGEIEPNPFGEADFTLLAKV
jgi:hypothetical protein